ncbi:hypothetical protein BD769DRAFT_1398019 [Suillus cothurnatus]|nr:hypothetical protein BD769DRAFT_1398019 [Suillus cothurnatus]
MHLVGIVSIYPLDERAVQLQDGSLPVMSYWYGKVLEIYLNPGGQDVWLDIKWYYRKVDLEDEGVDLAASVGEHELVLSDHTSVVDMCCVEDHATILAYDEGDLAQPQIPIGTLYNRWTIDIKFSSNRQEVYMEGLNIRNSQEATTCACNRCHPAFSSPTIFQRYCRKCARWFNEECVASIGRQLRGQVKPRVPSTYAGINFDPEFLLLLTSPIRRGDSYGVVGNG